MEKLKTGAVPFLNSKPLLYGLEKGGPVERERFELEYLPPAECASRLRAGELDLALIPSIEFARAEGLRIVPDLAVTSEGEVLSVILYCSVPLERVGSVAVDSRSRTSVALLRILCSESFGIDPEFIEAEPEIGSMLSGSDAALLIGDDALHCGRKGAGRVDLGAAWYELTGQPFVYAFWAGRAGALGAEDVAMLRRSLGEGRNHLHKIVANHPSSATAKDLNWRYLSEVIGHELGEHELTGLKLFYIKALEHGLISGVPRLRFYEG